MNIKKEDVDKIIKEESKKIMNKQNLIAIIVFTVIVGAVISILVFQKELNYDDIHIETKKAVVISEIYKEEWSGRVQQHVFYVKIKNSDGKKLLIKSNFCQDCETGDSVLYSAEVGTSISPKNPANDLFEIKTCTIIYKKQIQDLQGEAHNK